MNDFPILSVIIPVHNSELYLEQCIHSIINQKINGEIEIICIDDGSTDNSLLILKKFKSEYKTITVLEQENLGAGVARNKGLDVAKGNFIHFLDSDDWMEDGSYQFIIDKMMKTNVDVCVFQKYLYDEKTKLSNPSIKAFSTDEYITNLNSNPSFLINNTVVPWNKIIRRKFIMENNLRYDSTVCANDRTFYFSLLAKANSIMITQAPLIYYRVNNSKSLIGTTRSIHYDAHFDAYKSTMKNVESLDSKKKSMIADAAIIDMLRFYDRAHPIYKIKIYFQLHHFFNEAYFFGAEKENSTWKKRFEYIKNHKCGFPLMLARDYYSKIIKNKNKHHSKKRHQSNIIVSLTSYPARISSIHITIESIINQTVRPKKIILWLAKEQFPTKEEELPKNLLRLKAKGLTIEFCDDLKPHKKYFYAMQKYPDDIIITFDDDVEYDEDVIECLIDSYHRHPAAISAMRAHRILTNRDEILPYSDWKFEDNSFFNLPSLSAMATGVGGVLYPPQLLSSELFDKDGIENSCLFGDDLWLKTFELLNEIPTVLASKRRNITYVKGTQENALWVDNKTGRRNDTYIQLINDFIKERYNKNLLELFVKNDIRLSLLINYDKYSLDEIAELHNSLPKWVEIILFGITDGKILKNIRKRFGFSQRIRLIHQEHYQIQLHKLASFSKGKWICLVQNVNSIDNEFYANCNVLRNETSIRQIKENYVVNSSKLIQLKVNILDDLVIDIINSEGKITSLNGIKINSEDYNYSYLRRMLFNAGRGIEEISDIEIQQFLLNNNIFIQTEYDIELLDSNSIFDPNPISLNSHVCPICGISVNNFIAGGAKLRDGVKCPYCGSLERHRALWLNVVREANSNFKNIALVNYPHSTHDIFKSYGIRYKNINEIINEGLKYSIIALCNVLKQGTDIEKLLNVSDKIEESGKILITSPLILKDNIWFLKEMGISFDELCEQLKKKNFNATIKWNSEIFQTDELEMYSLLNNELTIMCEKQDCN